MLPLQEFADERDGIQVAGVRIVSEPYLWSHILLGFLRFPLFS